MNANRKYIVIAIYASFTEAIKWKKIIFTIVHQTFIH